jgi:hypothetical protein
MKWLKLIVTPLVLAGLMAQTFSLLCIYESYTLNQSYIAAHFCQNRSMPKMHCNGHCYLSKKMQSEQQNEKQLPNNLNEKVNMTPVCCHDNIALLPPPEQQLVSSNFNYTFLIGANFLSSPFQPPRLLS